MTDELKPLEDRLRAALQQQAGRAPRPHGVIEEIESRARRMRHRRRLLATAGTTMAAAAVAGPVAALRSWLRHDGPEAHPQPVATSPTRPPDALPYRPTWLPDGAGEIFRAVSMLEGDRRFDRKWRATVGGRHVEIDLRTLRDQPVEGDEVDINGVRGVLRSQSVAASVYWRVSNGVMLGVTVRSDDKADHRDLVLRVARSVRPDGATRIGTLVRFGWLPTGWFLRTAGVGTWPDGRLESSVAASWGHTGNAGFLQAVVWAATIRRKDGAVPIIVRGRPGWYYAHPYQGDVVTLQGGSSIGVNLSGGLALWVKDQGGTTVPPPLDKATLLKVADSLVIDEQPDLSWLAR